MALVGLLAGCNTVQTQKFCADYEAQYKQYVELVGSGVIPKPEVIAAAKIAAAMLESYCQWWGPQSKGLTGDPVVDANGVRVVHPPNGPRTVIEWSE